MTHEIDEWTGCYPSQWKGMIVPEAIAHPAKFSSRLIRRIYDHMIEMDWLKPGDSVLDPFGGVALGALESMRHGLRWRGVELEAKFADPGNRNIDFWNSKFSTMPKWNPDAVLINGDSRKLLEVLPAAVRKAAKISPPFSPRGNQPSKQIGLPQGVRSEYDARGENPSSTYGNTDGQLADMPMGDFMGALSSPPYADRNIAPGGIHGVNAGELRQNEGDTYGVTPGQLGAMGEGDFLASISSPPFRQSEGGTPEPKPGGPIDEALYKRHAAGNSAASGYGSTDGQLADMPEGDFTGVMKSPPFRDGLSRDNVTAGRTELARDKGISNAEKISPIDMEKIGKREQEYGQTEGQLGTMPEGNLTAAISSPPYTGNVQVQKNSTGINLEKMYETYKKSGGGASFEAFCKTQELHSQGYGDSEGQLGVMPEGDFEGTVSSPPYLPQSDRKVPWVEPQGTDLQAEDERRGYRADNSFRGTYSHDPANLGNPTGADQTSFWEAARVIVDQVYQALTPGGHAVWVVKDFVKNKEKVPFCDQWRQLCEAVGFVTMHEHHAMLVHATQYKLDGGVHRKESKSFFRRVAEGKGSPRVDYEVVFCMEKPQ